MNTLFEAQAIYEAGRQDGMREGAIQYGEHAIDLLARKEPIRTLTARQLLRTNLMKIVSQK